MKKIYVAAALLAVCISLCIFEQYTVESTYKTAVQYIDCAIEYADRQDYKNAEKVCAELNRFWEKKYNILKSLIDHSALDEASVTISSLEAAAEDEDDELKSQLVSAKNQIRIIRDNQRVTFGNIF